MSTRIVVADQAEARIYDFKRAGAPMPLVLRLTNTAARLHDRDLKSDRPGRVFDRAPSVGSRRGATARHATGGERSPRKLEARRFAREIDRELDRGRHNREFDRLAIVAGQPFRGILLAALSERQKALVTKIVPKDLVHQSERALRTRLGRLASRTFPPRVPLDTMRPVT